MKKTLLLPVLLVMILPFSQVQSQDPMSIMSQLTNPSKPATFENSYEFDSFLRMEMTTSGQTMVYDSYVNKANGNIAMVFTIEGAPTKVIIDSKNESMLFLTAGGGQKAGFAMSVDPEAMQAMATDMDKKSQETPPEHLKTGKTKTILGYRCDEYMVKDGTSEVHIWASEKLGAEIGKETLNSQKLFGGAFSHALFGNGMVMEYVYKDGSEEMTVNVTDIKVNASHTISTSGYNVMSLGPGMQF